MRILGERIRRKRENLHLQLNDLAKKVGISSSALSQIENAKAFPSIVTLKSIADNLKTTVGELIGEHEALSNNPIIRYDDISFVDKNESGCSSYLLSNHGANKQLDTLLLKFKPGANSNHIVESHPGQTFLFVLDGEINVTLDDNIYIVRKNDSFYLNSYRPHSFDNKSSEEARLIMISTAYAN